MKNEHTGREARREEIKTRTYREAREIEGPSTRRDEIKKGSGGNKRETNRARKKAAALHSPKTSSNLLPPHLNSTLRLLRHRRLRRQDGLLRLLLLRNLKLLEQSTKPSILQPLSFDLTSSSSSLRIASDPVLFVVLGRRDGDVKVVESTGFEMVDCDASKRG